MLEDVVVEFSSFAFGDGGEKAEEEEKQFERRWIGGLVERRRRCLDSCRSTGRGRRGSSLSLRLSKGPESGSSRYKP